MARPGFVHEVDERTPALLVHSGADFAVERFPLGTQVVYPADPVPTGDDATELIAAAVAAPVGSAPLAQRLRPGMKLTISYTDVSAPLPRMRRPDVRGQVIEQVLALAAAAGVDDVALVAASGINRRLTEDEQAWILGERVMRSFFGDNGTLICHDAEDADALVSIGQTRSGHEVMINRRVAESDLVVHVVAATSVAPSAHLFTAAGGWDSVLTGLGSAATLALRFGQAAEAVEHADRAAELAGVVAEHVPVFAIEAALNNAMFGPSTALLGRREWDWGIRDRIGFVALRRALAISPHRSRERLFSAASGPFGVISVSAGDPAEANRLTTAALLDQHRVAVPAQTDVLITGVGQLSPFSVDSTPNPLVAAAMAGQAVARHTTVEQGGAGPLVRSGGALIIYHPATPAPAGRQQPSTPDFWTDVLAVTHDSATMADRFEPTFAADPWYRHLYRSANAYHALQPFHLWYSLDALRRQVSDVVWVGADRGSVEQLGFRAASTLADALEMVSTQVGRTPSIGLLHAPPDPWVDVSGATA